MIPRIARSTRCLSSADLTEPTIVTLPLSTNVLTSSFDNAGSAASAASICDWIVASSTAADSVVTGEGVGDAEGLLCGVGEIVGDALGVGESTGPAGMVCCGASDAVPGSNGRLVMNNARKVAMAAATITLIAIHGSVFRGGG